MEDNTAMAKPLVCLLSLLKKTYSGFYPFFYKWVAFNLAVSRAVKLGVCVFTTSQTGTYTVFFDGNKTHILLGAWFTEAVF